MAKQKTRNRKNSTLSVVLDVIDTADAVLHRITGKDIPGWLREFQEQSRAELGQSQSKILQPQAIPSDPYAVLGLPATASLEQVKKRYRQLAGIFHPDHEDGYDQAMKLLNEAYEQICREKEARNQSPRQ